MYIDKHNGNNKWAEAIKLEIDQKYEHGTYKNVGTDPLPKDCNKIRSHFAFDVKNYERYKVRLVYYRHLTDVPLSSVCSVVVSLRGVSLVLF